MNTREKGNFYEQCAVELVEKKGYTVLERNYLLRGGEIDIIAKKGETIVFLEIKQRSNDNFGVGEEAVDYKKLKRIYQTAKKYVYIKKLYDYSFRFDVIAYNGKSVQWIENILWGDEFEC
ncbi:MAG: YraN family protein [Fusobacteriaceae bacterium]